MVLDIYKGIFQDDVFDDVFEDQTEQGWCSGESARLPQCVPGSIPALAVISVLVLYSPPRNFSPGTPVFPSPQKPTFDLI